MKNSWRVCLELVLPLKKKSVEKLNHVPEDDLSEVMDFLEFLVWKAQQPQVTNMKSISTAEALRALRGHGKGEQLVERLLEARKADRKIDEQSYASLCEDHLAFKADNGVIASRAVAGFAVPVRVVLGVRVNLAVLGRIVVD